jgi:predicted Zn-dependent protease
MVNKVLLGLLALLLTACAVSPTGRQQFMMMNPQQMSAMGTQAFAELKDATPVERNRRVNAYVQCVASAITRELGPGQEPWEVVVFQDKAVNAFALPGGKIGVNTGLLKVAKNQDQLAAVIGHEVGHVLAQHANERASQQFAVQGGLAIVEALSGSPNSPSRQALLQALGLGAQVGILLPYSRVHESEADRIGLDLMARAGFDPRQSVALWENMARASSGQPPEFLSTHPAHSTRINGLRQLMGPAMRTYEAARAMGKRPGCR